MKRLANFLFDHITLDFDGDFDVEQVRQLLRNEESDESRALLAKLIEEKGIDDMLIVVSECLKEQLRSGIDERTLQSELLSYSES